MTEQTHKQELTITVDVPKGYKAVDYRAPREGELYLTGCGRAHTASDDYRSTRFPILKKEISRTITIPEIEIKVEDAQILYHLINLSFNDKQRVLSNYGVDITGVYTTGGIYKTVGERLSRILEESYGIDLACGGNARTRILTIEELENSND